MTVVFQPCRCLWRASVQITRTTRSRRMILQLRQIFFTEARTFIIVLQIQDAARRRRSINGFRSARPALTLEAALLQQTLVLMRHQMRLDLGHEIHDHHYDDQ